MPDGTPQIPKLGLHTGTTVVVCLVATAVGATLGWGADALLGWFQSTFDGAPALLRAAAALPDVVTIVALAVAGLAFGLFVVADWERETMVCEIEPDGVRTRLHKRTSWVDRGSVATAFADGNELVLADATGRMLAVGKVDGVGRRRLARAFTEAGYPWSDGGHPWEGRFAAFIEGRDDLSDPAARLIRARATAIEDGEKARARELRAELSEAGVLVRDRRGEQEYVVLSEAGSTK